MALAAATATAEQRLEKSAVWFDSDGVNCAADLYRPTTIGGISPCVVMAHGTAGTRDLGLHAYAEGFARAGLAVLVFDYRHFGESGGQPRQLIDIQEQLGDYRAAIRFARKLRGVDPNRVALWGTSLSGGHVMEIAAEDHQIAAVVSQVPFAGIEFGRATPRSRTATLKLLAAALLDGLHRLLGLQPFLVPLVGPATSVSAFNDPDALETLKVLAADAPTWRNAFAARAILALMKYRPGEAAPRIRVPILVCIAEADTAGSVKLAVRAAQRAPRGELLRYPVGHFAVYTGEVMHRLIADETAFLRRHLLG